MKQLVIYIYIHGKGGSSEEAEHYKCLFSESDVIGLSCLNPYPIRVLIQGVLK